MNQPTRRRTRRRRKSPTLPELEQAKAAVLHTLGSLRRSKILLPTICAGAALACVMNREESWSRSQFLLGHASVLTTERYIGCKQRLSRAANDRITLHSENSPKEDLSESTG